MILRPWLGTNKPPLGVRPIPGHPLARGLVGCWLFNESSGGLVADSTPSRNSGTLTNMTPATDWGLSPFGSALEFDGVNRRVLVPRTAELRPPNQVTFAAWVRRDLTTGNFDYIMASEGPVSDALIGFDTGAEGLRLYVNSGGLKITTYTYTWETSAWVLVAGVWDGQFVRLYLNGLPVGTPTAATAAINYTGGSYIEIGHAHTSATTQYGWDGQIAAAFMWSRGLGPDEVGLLYRSPWSMFGVPDLAAMWAAQAVAAGHPALRRLGLFDTGFGFDRSRETRWG